MYTITLIIIELDCPAKHVMGKLCLAIIWLTKQDIETAYVISLILIFSSSHVSEFFPRFFLDENTVFLPAIPSGISSRFLSKTSAWVTNMISIIFSSGSFLSHFPIVFRVFSRSYSRDFFQVLYRNFGKEFLPLIVHSKISCRCSPPEIFSRVLEFYKRSSWDFSSRCSWVFLRAGHI